MPAALNYAEINRKQRGATRGACTVYTARQALRRCRESARPGCAVLDYGCSNGRAAQVFTAHGLRVTGVDVVPERIEEAAPFCAATFLRTDMHVPLPFGADSFDLVFAAQLIEHLTVPDAQRFLAEAYTLLKPGGRIFLSAPNPHSLRILLGRLPMIRGSHLSCWSIESLTRAVAAAGFRNARRFGNGRAALYIGDLIPCRLLYGGFAVIAEKADKQKV